MKNALLLITVCLFNMNLFAQGVKVNSNTKGNEKLGKDILSFTPAQMMLTTNNGGPDAAVGISYERIFDNELLSFRLPVSFSLTNQYVYFMPTLKLYPKKQGVAKFAVGPQLLIGYGKGTYNQYLMDINGMSYTKTVVFNRKQFGFLVNPSANFTIAKHFYLCVEGSLGLIYYDNMPNNEYYYTSSYSYQVVDNNRISPAFQMNFNFGYRF